MKKILGVLILVVVAVFQTQAADQTPQQRLSREQLAKKQAEHIARNLVLDDKTAALFIDAYCECQKEVWTVEPCRVKSEGSSEENSERFIKQRFENSEKLLAIRQKYYKKYSEFLTQCQIRRVYEIEKKMKQKMVQRRGKMRRGKMHRGNR